VERSGVEGGGGERRERGGSGRNLASLRAPSDLIVKGRWRGAYPHLPHMGGRGVGHHPTEEFPPDTPGIASHELVAVLGELS